MYPLSINCYEVVFVYLVKHEISFELVFLLLMHGHELDFADNFLPFYLQRINDDILHPHINS